jgi:catechol 2,3-dioxygenase-like lactoylglutathione lyase family enzyme
MFWYDVPVRHFEWLVRLEVVMIRHVAGIADIVDDVASAVTFYRDTLGLSVEYEDGAQYANIHIPGVLHFGIWDRAAAAESVFGDSGATDRVPLGITVGFEVDEVASAAETLRRGGLGLLQAPKREPWGQATSRFLLPGGTLGEVAETPWARRIIENARVEVATESVS